MRPRCILLRDAIDESLALEIDAAVGDGGRGVIGIIEGIGGEKLESRAGFDDEGCARGGEIDEAIGGCDGAAPGGCVFEALGVNIAAGGKVDAAQDARSLCAIDVLSGYDGGGERFGD